MPRVELSVQAQHRFLLSVLLTVFAVSGANAQAPTDGNIEISSGGPDIETVEDLIREMRNAAKVAREDQTSTSPEEGALVQERAASISELLALIAVDRSPATELPSPASGSETGDADGEAAGSVPEETEESDP